LIDLWELLAIAILILLNGIFVGAEIALISIRRTRVEQLVDEGSTGARVVQRLIRNPGRFLAVTQIVVTFVGFLASAVAAVSLTVRVGELLARIPVLASIAEGLALLIVTAVVALFTIVFGELVPKTIGLGRPEPVAIFLARPIDWAANLLGPLVAFLTAVTNVVTRPLGIKPGEEASITAEEFRLLVERSGDTGVLEAEEEQMIHAVIELGDRRIHEVMVPRIDIDAVDVESDFDDVVAKMIDAGHSRIPAYEESIDNVVGILYAKDLLRFLKTDGDRPSLRDLLRTPYFAPESMTVDDLLHELQRRKVHIAIVLDEFGGTAGLVTIEDLLEEIVGEIQDEYDVEEPLVVKLSDNESRIDGRADIDDLVELYDIQLDEGELEQFDTVGGLVFHRLGGVPHVGDVVSVDGLTLTVESTDGRRVGKVLAVRAPRAQGGEGDNESG
jgi:magnesium and cobalt exporter, CNNM family